MHVNGGAYRSISVEEWRDLGGDDNRFCDWHEGIGYVVYDDIALSSNIWLKQVRSNHRHNRERVEFLTQIS